MNKNAKKWVSALESGKYRRTTTQLRDENSFCCLGVACDVYAKSHPKVRWIKNRFLGAEATLPKRVQKWLGLEGDGGEYDSSLVKKAPRVGDDALYGLNDGGWNFKRIAAFIKRNEKALFS